MKAVGIEKTLERLAALIAQGRFEEVETDTVELKPVPADGAEWRELGRDRDLSGSMG